MAEQQVQVNFGWLNDFSGAKFAPLTLSDKILMLNGDKTIDEYLNELTHAYNERHLTAEDNIDVLKATLKAMDNPYGEIENYPKNYFPGTKGNRQNLNKMAIDVFGANRLVNFGDDIVNTDNFVDINAVYERYGVSSGGHLVPVGFIQGAPVACKTISSIMNTQDDIASNLYIDLDSDVYSQDFYRSIGIEDEASVQAFKDKYYDNYNLNKLQGQFNFEAFDGNLPDNNDASKNSLKVNIYGNAGTAVKSLFSYQSGLAKNAIQAEHSLKANRLVKKLKFSDASDTAISATASDVHGLLEYSQNQTSEDSYNFGLSLRSILDTDGTSLASEASQWVKPSAGGFGVDTDVTQNTTVTSLGSFFIPHIEVDVTGRITNITQKAVRPSLDIRGLYDTDERVTSPTEAAVLGWTSGDKFFHAGSGNNGIYLSWKDDYNNPVLMGAAWNDYAEFRKQTETIEAGYCIASNDNGEVYKTTEKFQACDGIVSDTFGFSIGKSEVFKTPVAVAGRVLAYYAGDISDYHSGDTVCAGPEGKVYKMTREEIREWPDRIVGIVSEIPSEEKWNNVNTAGRIWIKVK